MASRVKKLFHRGKEDDGEQPPAPTHTRNPNSTRSDPALRTSLYESTMPGDLPQTGDYPVKGNDSSVALQHGRKSSSRSRRNSSSHHNMPHSSTTPNHYETSRNTRRMTPPPMVNSLEAGSYSPYLHAPAMPMGGNDDKRRDLPQDFSGLSLGNAAVPTTVTQTVTTTRTLHQASNANPGYSRNNTGIRAVDQEVPQNPKKGQPYLGDLPSNSMFYADNEQSWQGNDDANSSERTSIPRKQVGSSVNLQSPSIQSSPPSKPQIGRNRRQSAPKPLPSTPIASSDEYSNTDSRAMPQQSGVLDRSRPRPKEMVKQEVVDRAKNNTHDTQVIESMAPAVVHEKVHRDVHHVREELITREIHTHDVHHRILPVVDVEVLPPRHFLPVEGGGLVEVSAQEVPGRGNNWVIAETASKIPSDQAAPQGITEFTARRFPGREGDAVSCTTSEGYEKTEQTWVHPPELETGARDTGQSWPMMFDSPGKGAGGHSGSYGFSSPKTLKRHSP